METETETKMCPICVHEYKTWKIIGKGCCNNSYCLDCHSKTTECMYCRTPYSQGPAPPERTFTDENDITYKFDDLVMLVQQLGTYAHELEQKNPD